MKGVVLIKRTAPFFNYYGLDESDAVLLTVNFILRIDIKSCFYCYYQQKKMDVIKCTDYVIDVGFDGGDKGNYLVSWGTPEKVVKCKDFYNAEYLNEKLD